MLSRLRELDSAGFVLRGEERALGVEHALSQRREFRDGLDGIRIVDPDEAGEMSHVLEAVRQVDR
jgi:hypothetical protein